MVQHRSRSRHRKGMGGSSSIRGKDHLNESGRELKNKNLLWKKC